MGSWRVKAQAVLGSAVLASGIGAAVAGSGGGTLALAGPQVLRLIQSAPSSLATFPSVHLTMRMTVAAGSRTVTVNEQGQVAPDGSAGTLHADLPFNAGALDLVTVNHTIYGRVRPDEVEMAGGKRWVALTLTNLPATTGFQTGSDALSYFRLLPGASGHVHAIGTQKIGGVQTTRYRVNVDLVRAAAKLPPQLQQPGALDLLRQAGLTAVPMDVWIDAQHFIRQTALHMSLRGVQMTITMTVRGSTSRLHVEPPPAGDTHPVTTITEFSQLVTGM